MSKSVQLEFEWELPEKDNSRTNWRGSQWYYIRRLADDTMVILDEDGYYKFVPHDTIGNTPHLFNKRSLAKQVSISLPNTRIAKYKWDVR